MAGLIQNFLGHGSQKEWLLSSLKRGELPSALIFQGPQGVGKKTLAQALLQVGLCQASETACGECSHCLRALEEKNEFVYNIKLEGKKTIGVDQVREVHTFLSLKSLQSLRFVIIDSAEKLSIQASNALLKVLEEPPPQTHIILITEEIRSLLPTIRSRSHILKFNALTKEELKQWGDFDEVPLSWADGRLPMAIDLKEQETVDQLNESLQFLYSLINEAPQDWKKKAPWFFSNDQSREFNFNIWKQALEKRLYGESKDLEWLPEKSGSLSFVYESMESLKKDINSNVDKLLAVEGFYYKLHQRNIMQ